MIEHALRRGITTVDFSFNELAASDVGEVVQHASDLLLRAAAAHHHPGQAPSLFLQMRQFSRRWVVFEREEKGDVGCYILIPRHTHTHHTYKPYVGFCGERERRIVPRDVLISLFLIA